MIYPCSKCALSQKSGILFGQRLLENAGRRTERVCLAGALRALCREPYRFPPNSHNAQKRLCLPQTLRIENNARFGQKRIVRACLDADCGLGVRALRDNSRLRLSRSARGGFFRAAMAQTHQARPFSLFLRKQLTPRERKKSCLMRARML